MNAIHNLKIGTRLSALLGLMLVLCVIVGRLSSLRARDALRQMTDIIERRMVVIDARGCGCLRWFRTLPLGS